MAKGKAGGYVGGARKNGGPKAYNKTVGAGSDSVHHENPAHHNFNKAGNGGQGGGEKPMSLDKRGC